MPPTRLWRTPLRHRRSRAGPTSGAWWAGTRGCRTRSTLAPCRSRRRRQRLQALREQSPICNPCGLVFSHICMSCVVWDRLWRHSSRLEKITRPVHVWFIMHVSWCIPCDVRRPRVAAEAVGLSHSPARPAAADGAEPFACVGRGCRSAGVCWWGLLGGRWLRQLQGSAQAFGAQLWLPVNESRRH